MWLYRNKPALPIALQLNFECDVAYISAGDVESCSNGVAVLCDIKAHKLKIWLCEVASQRALLGYFNNDSLYGISGNNMLLYSCTSLLLAI